MTIGAPLTVQQFALPFDQVFDGLVGVLAAKHHAVHSAWSVVDRAFELAGGMGIFKSSGWERILRDARLGRIHPANSFLTHELIAKLSLGINPDEQPRWG